MARTHMPIQAHVHEDPQQRFAQLEATLIRADERILEARLRIKRHCELTAVDGEPWQRRLHSEAYFNLLEGLKLLCCTERWCIISSTAQRSPGRSLQPATENASPHLRKP